MNKFTELGLNPLIIKAITELGYTAPTPVQEKAIPHIINSDQDLVALAQTGTGKTAAFGLPILSRINIGSKKVQAIILCPTRELCLQIYNDLASFSKYMPELKVVPVFGGASISVQIRDLKKGAQIVVGTPGRVQDLLNRKVLDISAIDYLVLDEADEMLNMGFKEEIDEILKTTPKGKRTLLFSATMPRAIASIASKYMNDPYEISVGEKNSSAKKIKHVYYVVNDRERYEALRRVLDFETDTYGIVFCRTKVETQEVASKLMQDGYPAEAIHGDLSQDQRTKVMNRFRKRNIQLLVATDVAARGIDVKDLTHVINYNLPDSLETYTHRSGRTGRADSSGVSMIIINNREVRQIKNIERKIGVTFEKLLVPKGGDVIQKQIGHLINLVEDAKVSPESEELMKQYLATLTDKFDYETLALKLLNLQVESILNKYKTSNDINSSAPDRGGNDRSVRGDRQRRDSSDRGSRSSSSRPERSPRSDRPERGPRPDKNYTFVQVQISVGRKSGFNKKDLFALVNSQKSLRGAEIGTIEIGDSATVFEIEDTLGTSAKKFLSGTKFKGREVNVDVI